MVNEASPFKITSCIVYGEDNKKPLCLDDIIPILLAYPHDASGRSIFSSGMTMLSARMGKALAPVYERICQSLEEVTGVTGEANWVEGPFRALDHMACLTQNMVGNGLCIPEPYRTRVVEAFQRIEKNYQGVSEISADLQEFREMLTHDLGDFCILQ